MCCLVSLFRALNNLCPYLLSFLFQGHWGLNPSHCVHAKHMLYHSFAPLFFSDLPKELQKVVLFPFHRQRNRDSSYYFPKCKGTYMVIRALSCRLLDPKLHALDLTSWRAPLGTEWLPLSLIWMSPTMTCRDFSRALCCSGLPYVSCLCPLTPDTISRHCYLNALPWTEASFDINWHSMSHAAQDSFNLPSLMEYC